MQLELGKKYLLPHGTGTLIGYEEFYDNGMKSKIVKEAHLRGTEFNGRHIFILDDYSKWPFAQDTHYAAWGNQIKEIP